MTATRQRFCCPRHGARGGAHEPLEREGDFYLIATPVGWTLAMVQRADHLETQEFQTPQQARAWVEGNPQPSLF